MKFTHHPLGHRKRGDIARVTLTGSAANVRLLDNSNFQKFRSGKQHRYQGGLVRQSPVNLQIPSDGYWHLTVDMINLRGSVRSKVDVLPGPLPEFRPPAVGSSAAIRNIASAAENASPINTFKEWDVFISHATEDKHDFARRLAFALSDLKLRPWYDEFELRIGDSLRRKIDMGLSQSRFGVVILSPAFFAKNWPKYELDGLVTLEMPGAQAILPIWHKISKAEVMAESPSLADKVALNTADYTVEEIAQQIAEVIKG